MSFRVLFSHASNQVYEDLMHPEVFEFEIMRETDQGWLSRKGETPVEVIRRRWTW